MPQNAYEELESTLEAHMKDVAALTDWRIRTMPLAMDMQERKLDLAIAV